MPGMVRPQGNKTPPSPKKRTLLFQHEFHFYYLHILLVVYAFLPALRVFVRSATRWEMEYLLGGRL